MRMSLYVYNENEPIYIQISESLLNDIRTNYEPGDFIPSEFALAERFGVNRHTIRRAVDELIRDGILGRYRGRGTAVLELPIDFPIHRDSRFTDTLTKKGHIPVSQVLKKEMITAFGGTAKRLKIERGTPILWMETLRLVDGRPMGISSQFLPEPYASTVYHEYQDGSLHKFIHELYGIEIRREYSLITAVLPQEDDARILQMSQRLPLLRLKTVNIELKTKKPVEYAVARSRADSVQIRVEID